jgi:hypothetical protein
MQQSAAQVHFLRSAGGMNPDLNILIRLGVALILSGILGWARKNTCKAAGIRAHMLGMLNPPSTPPDHSG